MNEPLPHRSVFRLLRTFCPAHLYEEIEGDLLQCYEKDIVRIGTRGAGLRLYWNALRFFRPGIIFRNKFSAGIRQNYMTGSYFTVALRHLWRAKTFSAIDIAGLAVGMSAFILIIIYAGTELSFDKFHTNKDSIYRVAYLKYKDGEMVGTSAKNYFGVGPYLKENFAEVEDVVRFYRWPANTGAVMMADGKIFNERNYFFAEPSFFKVFPSLLERGDISNCLKDHNSVVLSRSLAKKMFGTEDALGKVITRLDVKDLHLTVTGIMRDMPAQSHFSVDVVIPYDEDWVPAKEDQWKYANEWTYFTIKPGTDPEKLETKLNRSLSFSQKDNPDYDGAQMLLQAITDIHLYSDLDGEITPNGRAELVYGIGLIGLLILLVSWINYVNLQISQFINRVKEVGVRRIIGSTKGQIALQFFIQYLCVCIAASICCAFLIFFVIPYYDLFTGVPADIPDFELSWQWITILGFFVAGTLVAGVYPSLFVMRFNPVLSLKGQLGRFKRDFLKGGMVTIQFTVSMALLAFMIVVSQQLGFMRSIGKNMDAAQVLTVYNSTSYTVFEDSLRKERSLAFRDKILQHPAFESVTASSVVPGDAIGFTYHNLTKRSLTDPDDGVPYKVLFVDYYFAPVFGLKMKAGRNYSDQSGDDKSHNTLVLNESAIRALGFTSAEEAVGKEIYFMVTFDWKKYKIIGVVEDYRHESVKAPIHPTIFFLHEYVGQMTYYSIRLSNPANSASVVAYARDVWEEIWPGKPFDFFFVDSHYDQQYKTEVYFGRIVVAFSSVAVFLACLGILGISLFEVRARLREISIRKVLGASMTGIALLLSQGYGRVILISSGLSIPIIWIGCHKWLSNYPVRIEMSPLFFVGPLLIVIILVAATAGFQTLKAASTNPVDHLKNE